jgi:hypothetical protein
MSNTLTFSTTFSLRIVLSGIIFLLLNPDNPNVF